MNRMFQTVAVILLSTMVPESIAFAIDSKNTGYCGGTVGGFDGAKDVVEGVLDTKDSSRLIFR